MKGVVEFRDLPEYLRVKLDENGETQLWKTIDEFGGVKEFCDTFEYSDSKLYNYRNKDVFIPVKLVKQVLGMNASDTVTAVKGSGRSKTVRNPVFPMQPDSELLTRINCSVNVNRNGIPVYQTDERLLADRFGELLQQYGEVPFKIYNRELYELRYPKFLHELLAKMNYTPDRDALVDEKAVIEGGEIRFDTTAIPVKEFSGTLHSRRKRYQLAIARNDNDEIARIMSELGRLG